LPVRRRELERNIKREWGKVINLLNQYACVQTGIKFTVSQQPNKGKRMVLFSTKGNPTTRENIINVFGVKTMNALITLDLKLELKPTSGPGKKGAAQADDVSTEVRVVGHVSRPTHGEGRQTPDRQMFYINGRPCGLPQFAKVFNEVYRSYNSTQSPFIFADIQLDTHLYDVNVSPDKRTILLHDQGQMLENLRESLVELFEIQDVTIPVAQSQLQKNTPFKKPVTAQLGTPSTVASRGSKGATASSQQPASPISRDAPRRGSQSDGDEVRRSGGEASDEEEGESSSSPKGSSAPRGPGLLSQWLNVKSDLRKPADTKIPSPPAKAILPAPGRQEKELLMDDEESATPRQDATAQENPRAAAANEGQDTFGEDSNGAEADIEDTVAADTSKDMEVEREESPVPSIPPPSQLPAPKSSFVPSSRLLKRPTQEVATITIGDHSVISVIGSSAKRPRTTGAAASSASINSSNAGRRTIPVPSFGGRLSQLFSAEGSTGSGPADNLDVDVEDMEISDKEASDDESDEDALFVKQPDDEHCQDDDQEHGHEHERENDHVHESYKRSHSRESAGKASESHVDHEQPVPEAVDSPIESVESPSFDEGERDEDGDEYIDEDEKKAREDKRVHEMIEAAEAKAVEKPDCDEKRHENLLKWKSKQKDRTLNLVQNLNTNESAIRKRFTKWTEHLPSSGSRTSQPGKVDGGLEAEDAEAKLALKISKSDFGKMRIIGQFNLGFILAVREAASSQQKDESNRKEDLENNDDDELFIIDQHASDEKYNFERLQASTVVQSQRLVQPKTLELTAVEEEIIIEHVSALERNGFSVRVDQSGDKPVGSRCELLSLPLSRETTFSLADLEELIFLLGDNPSSCSTTIPRPTKVRKMFAMRACRSSIMIGQALSRRQMENVVRHMGEMEKPWNCPHGRPTMRHLCGLGAAWDDKAWLEGDDFDEPGARTDWASWARKKREEEDD